MKSYNTVFILCALLGCTTEAASHQTSAKSTEQEPTEDVPQTSAMEEDAGTPPEVMPPVVDAGMPAVKKKPKTPKPVPPMDAGVTDAQVDSDAHVDSDASADAGMHDDAGHPTVDAGPPHSGSLRNLTVRLTGMDDDLHHFSQFRLANEAREFETMFVIHEGLTSATYQWELPNVLFTDESYTLDFFIDHNETTGPGFYDVPPIDHAWSIPIAAGTGDVMINFPFNTDYTDIEGIAPTPFHSTILASSGMSDYIGSFYDVRLIERSTGRLAGRQLREVPGDSFDLTVGSTTQEGVEYEIDVAVDVDRDGNYEHATEPSWRLFATGGADGLHVSLDSSAAQTDVGF